MPIGDAGPSQSKKLGLKPGLRIHIDSPPPKWSFIDPPSGLIYSEPPLPADLVLSFFSESAQLDRRLPALVKQIFPVGVLWIAWPRRAGGHESDITDNIIRTHALPLGIVDVKVAAIDADWSGLKMMWRVELRGQNSKRR